MNSISQFTFGVPEYFVEPKNVPDIYINQDNLNELEQACCNIETTDKIETILNALPSYDAKIQLLHCNDERPFYIACANDNINVIQLLIQIGNNMKSPINVNIHNGIMFKVCCRRNSLTVAKLLFDKYNFDLHYNNDEYIWECCFRNHVNFVKWLCEKAREYGKPFNSVDIANNETHIKVFENACLRKYIDVVEFMYNICENKHVFVHSATYHKEIIGSCWKGNIQVAKWLYDTAKHINPEYKTTFFPVGKSEYLDNIFIDKMMEELCKQNYIDVLKWLCETFNIVPHAQSFFVACFNSSYDTARFVYELRPKKPKITSGENKMFSVACLKGNLKMLKFLFGICKGTMFEIDLRYKNDDFFKLCCEFERLDCAQWIYDMCHENDDDIDIHADNEYIFGEACRKGHLSTAKWIIELGKQSGKEINIRANGDFAFRKSCEKYNYDTAKWLAEMCEDYVLSRNAYDSDDDGPVTWIIKTWETYSNNEVIEKLQTTLKMNTRKKSILLNDDDYCTICRENPHDGICMLPCKHIYCCRCFVSWNVQRGGLTNHPKQCAYCMQTFKMRRCYVIPTVNYVTQQHIDKKTKIDDNIHDNLSLPL